LVWFVVGFRFVVRGFAFWVVCRLVLVSKLVPLSGMVVRAGFFSWLAIVLGFSRLV
jgi:hypothetical protein